MNGAIKKSMNVNMDMSRIMKRNKRNRSMNGNMNMNKSMKTKTKKKMKMKMVTGQRSCPMFWPLQPPAKSLWAMNKAESPRTTLPLRTRLCQGQPLLSAVTISTSPYVPWNRYVT